MNHDEVASLRDQYSRLTEEELSEIIEKVAVSPDSFTESARIALKQVISERGVTIEAVLRERREGRRKDAALLDQRQAASARRRKTTTRIVGRVIGALALPAGAIIAVQSLWIGHIGGLIAAVATVVCSLWLLLFYKG